MNPLRIFATIGLMIGFFWGVSFMITHWIVPDEVDPTVSLNDITRSRAPADAKGLKNPIAASETVVKSGKEIYLGAGNCHICHGTEGRGDGEAGAMLNPPPRDLTDTAFQMLRTDGEIFWSIKEGVPQTGMFSYVPRMITEEDAWKVVHYIRTLRVVQ